MVGIKLLEFASIPEGLFGPRRHFRNLLRAGLSATAVAWLALPKPQGRQVGQLPDSDSDKGRCRQSICKSVKNKM